jgi:hypothetical protein
MVECAPVSVAGSTVLGMEPKMAALQPPICEFGWKARDFALKGVDGKTYSLKDVRGVKGRSSSSCATTAPM